MKKDSVILLAVCLSLNLEASERKHAFNELVKPVFQESCIKCHGEKGKVKGKLNLLKINTFPEFQKDAERIEKIITAIEDGEMPPEEETQIPESKKQSILKELEVILKESILKNKSFARTPIRRMNRFQYANAVKDLLNLKVEVYPLPEKMMRDRSNYFRPDTGKMPDKMTVSSRPLGKSGLIEPRLAGVAPFPQDLRAENGFDNQGDHLSLSPFLMESFLTLASSIVQSTNFNNKTCGSWNALFAQPKQESNILNVSRERLYPFLSKAFRRPVEKNVIERYAEHVENLVSSGKSFTNAMKETVSAVLASPRFLYLYDRQVGKNSIEKIDDYELASRLSFFLWGSLPDEVLLKAAKSGRLSDPVILNEQLDRMLKDRRIKRFCDSFPSQWLQLDRIISSVPDVKKYPDFYYAPPNYRTTMDMMMEPLLLFENVLIEDRSILELIDSNYSFRSARLAKWYDPEIKGRLGGPTTMQFQRVALTDRRQGGVITSAAVLTMTSGPEETKPITRGAWIAGVIFNDPPEPPPADVPPLEHEDPDNAEKKTFRERFAQHRERADCAGCHVKLDPLGFALENFDAVGRWRDNYENGQRIDSSGKLFRQYEFSSIIEFKDTILLEKDRFTRALAAHLLAFALGREVTVADSEALDLVAKMTAERNYSLRAMIYEITRSKPFQSKFIPNEN
ncbi:DUF1592 domain-containing protein [Verrucomicrobia bacterium]|nr:DUF1592 domain-containing protein [Verrucomicrobiota bacterium]|tara:strand:+ start:887 stop:2929 length:2043 start_codon:yes stop_codon:yes gene_type:complete